MDVIALLRKSNQAIDGFAMRGTGDLSKQAPLEYISIHIIYDFTGNPEVNGFALNAVTDSQERYCEISHMLKRALPVSWEINFNASKLSITGHIPWRAMHNNLIPGYMILIICRYKK